MNAPRELLQAMADRRYAGSPRGQGMKAETRAVLEYLHANPGVNVTELGEAFPATTARDKLGNLSQQGYAYSVRVNGEKLVRWYAYDVPLTPAERALRTVQRAPKPARQAESEQALQIAAPRSVPLDMPWREPYLTDAGVRASGLQFRECGSRRGDRLVYCYRRAA